MSTNWISDRSAEGSDARAKVVSGVRRQCNRLTRFTEFPCNADGPSCVSRARRDANAVQDSTAGDLVAGGHAERPAAAGDDDKPKWGEAGVWDIFVDTDHGNRCYATSGSLGAAMLISIRPDGDLDFVIGHESWQFAEAGKAYRLKFVFGNETTYEEELEGMALESAVVLGSQMSPAFLSDFMQRTILLVYHEGSLIAPVSLRDTYEVVNQLRACDASATGVIGPTGPSVW